MYKLSIDADMNLIPHGFFLLTTIVIAVVTGTRFSACWVAQVR